MSTYKHSSGRLLSNLITAAIVALIAGGCIKNDIPYPRIQPDFTELTVEHESQASSIDPQARDITVFLTEDADIYNVKVESYRLSCGELADSTIFNSPINLSEPFSVDVTLYQTYAWTIHAVQEISREFVVANQIGASVIDAKGHRIVATVPETVNLKKLKVLSMKLGGPNSTIMPNLVGETVDFSTPVKVDVEEYGRTTTWTIYIETTESSVTTVRADAWTNVAWLYGEAEAGKDNGFEYRLSSVEEWTKVPSEWVTHDGGKFTGRLIHLQPETEYVARAYSDNEFGAEVQFLTGTIVEMPNSSMDHWWLDGKVWNPWAEGGTPYWDTGNKGATTLGASNSIPTDDTSTGTGRAAKLETRFVGIGAIGKLAAGNLFTGSYVRTDGTNGVLSFGREFTQRPTRLRGYMKYHSAPISSTTAGFANLKDRPDSCIIWCALIDSDEPFEIRTNPNNRHLFDPAGPEVVAYGKIEVGYDITSYVPFDIELQYTATNRRPKYIITVCSASKYGDYFTGGNGSVLYVDDFVLEYDY